MTVLTIDSRIAGPRYALSGQIRYEGVDAAGYLGCGITFPISQYFSRTLGDAGPMMKLQGTSGWRAFTLPFDSTGARPHATGLECGPARARRGVSRPGALDRCRSERWRKSPALEALPAD